MFTVDFAPAAADTKGVGRRGVRIQFWKERSEPLDEMEGL